MAPGVPLSLARRRVLAGGVLVGTLALGGGALFWPRREAGRETAGSWHFLRPADRAALAALAPALLGPSLWPAPDAAAEQRLAQGVDLAIAYLLPRTRDELRQLFDLLASPGGRWLLLGQCAAWDGAAPAGLAAGLSAWRGHRLDLLRAAYDGLRELVYAVWYGDPAHWPALGYPGTGSL